MLRLFSFLMVLVLCLFVCAHVPYHSFVAQLPGTTQDHLQIFNIEMKAKMKSHQMLEQVMICQASPFTFCIIGSYVD